MSEGLTCPVCLKRLTHRKVSGELGRPKSCDHFFCYPCILEWSKNVNTCPVDRLKFNEIAVYRSFNKTPVRTVKVPDTSLSLSIAEEATFCEVCNRCTREDRMLLCDGCDKGYHLECLTPPLSEVPEGDWYCTACEPIIHSQYSMAATSSQDDSSDYEYVLPRRDPHFRLDLNSSDVDVTGSDSDPFESLDLESESSSSCSLLELSIDSEDSFVEMESSNSMLSSEGSSINCTLPRDPLLPTRALRSSDKGGGRGERGEEVSDVESSDSEIFLKRPRICSNQGLVSPCSSDSDVVIVGYSTMWENKRRRRILSEDSDSDKEIDGVWFNLGTGKASPSQKDHMTGHVTDLKRAGLVNGASSGKGKGPISASKKPVIKSLSKRNLISQLSAANGTKSANSVLPSNSSTTQDPSRDQSSCHAPENGCALNGVSNGHDGTSTANDKGPRAKTQSRSTARQRGKRKRRRKAAAVGHPLKKKRRRRRQKRRKQGVQNNRPFAVPNMRDTRSRARTAATHTPLQNVMRAAVRESYRHDNQLEGLEWARAILARTITTPSRTHYFQNFPTPVSGFVDRKQSPTKTRRESSSPPLSRTYGFTPKRTRPIQPSAKHTPTPPKQTGNPRHSNAVATTSNSEDSLTPKERRFAEIKRRIIPRKRRSLSQVLITPLKLWRKECSDRRKTVGPADVSSSSECCTASSDLLGEMCRGMDVLGSKGGMVERDGTVVSAVISDSGLCSGKSEGTAIDSHAKTPLNVENPTTQKSQKPIKNSSDDFTHKLFPVLRDDPLTSNGQGRSKLRPWRNGSSGKPGSLPGGSDSIARCKSGSLHRYTIPKISRAANSSSIGDRSDLAQSNKFGIFATARIEKDLQLSAPLSSFEPNTQGLQFTRSERAKNNSQASVNSDSTKPSECAHHQPKNHFRDQELNLPYSLLDTHTPITLDLPQASPVRKNPYNAEKIPEPPHTTTIQANPKPVIRKILDSYFDQGEITNRQYKRILERASRKVQEGLAKSSYLSKSRVTKLVADYVEAYKYHVPTP